jgi:hypothetical protein
MTKNQMIDELCSGGWKFNHADLEELNNEQLEGLYNEFSDAAADKLARLLRPVWQNREAA